MVLNKMGASDWNNEVFSEVCNEGHVKRHEIKSGGSFTMVKLYHFLNGIIDRIIKDLAKRGFPNDSSSASCPSIAKLT